MDEQIEAYGKVFQTNLHEAHYRSTNLRYNTLFKRLTLVEVVSKVVYL